ncbi:MAG: hypothetical protein CSB48_05285 [Proteobacteria bacterium]|nr:MAG: hypothetical protein CSB48_05285 [Pseudomonadota bacterium]
MIDPAFDIDEFRGENLPDAIKQLRQQVFIGEQNVPAELEWDELDPVAIHIGIREKNGNHYIGCARFLEPSPGTVIIGRMAVIPGNRRGGCGRQLLHHAIARGFDHFHCHTINLSAQVTAIPFYQNSGFLCVSEEYIEAGIRHRKMTLPCINNLLGALQDNRLSAHLPTPFHHGADTHAWFFSTPDLSSELLTAFAIQARDSIEIYDPALNPDIFDSELLTEYISKMVRQSRYAQVRILVKDDKSIAQSHHALVELAKRLPSGIRIQTGHPDFPDPGPAFVLVDRNMLMFRKDPGSPEGFANFSRPDTVRQLRDSFDDMWKRSRRSRELNTFGL